MYFRSLCGHYLDNTAFPNPIAHHVLSDRNRERLENLVDQECGEHGTIRMWPEHWEETTVEAWKCPVCERVYVNPTGPRDEVVVYRKERVGLPEEAEEEESGPGDP
jgi:hypothetical protein